VVDPASSNSANILSEGCAISGMQPTLKDGCPAIGISFYDCNQINAKAALCNGILVSGTLESGTNSAAMTATSGGTCVNSTFDGITSDYSLELTGNGPATYDLSGWDPGTPAVKPLRLTGTTGVWTISLALGQTQPDYDSAGATITWDQPVIQATGSVAGMVAGGRLYIYNQTTATEMVNSVQAGTTYSINYDNGTGYTAGDTIVLRWRKPDYEDIELITTATTGGWSFTLSPVLDVHYTGTTPANVTVDYVNKKIRATSTRDTFTDQDVVDIIKNAEATLDGIRLTAFADIGGGTELTPGVFTALTVELISPWQLSWASGSVANASVNGNIVGGVAGDVVEDIVGGPQVTVRLAQAGTTVAVGSGVTQQDKDDIVAGVWAYITRTLTSGGGGGGEADWTATERSQIRHRLGIDGTSAVPTAIPSLATPTNVRTELTTELSRIDVATSTRLAAAGYTAPANSDIAAIKAKTDNLPSDPASQSNLKGAANKDLTQVFNNTPSIDPSSVWNYSTRTLTVASGLTPQQEADLAAVKAKTDNLPADPASQSNLKGAANKDLTQVFNNTPSIDPSSVWTHPTRTLTDGGGAATLAEIEASTVLAKEATVTALQGADNRDLTEVYDLVLTRAEAWPVTPPILTVVGEDVIEAEDNSAVVVAEDPTATMTLDELSI
jgi:hypothetical protein